MRCVGAPSVQLIVLRPDTDEGSREPRRYSLNSQYPLRRAPGALVYLVAPVLPGLLLQFGH